MKNVRTAFRTYRRVRAAGISYDDTGWPGRRSSLVQVGIIDRDGEGTLLELSKRDALHLARHLIQEVTN